MVQTRTVEIAVGIFVAAGIGALFLLAMKVSNLSSLTDHSGYMVTAEFQNIGGLKVRAPVTVAGVRVGRVIKIDYNNKDYEAVVSMVIRSRYDRFPVDTSASIYTAGLLGEQYVSLEPGGANTYLKNGDRIKLTQSALILEQIIGQYLFNKASAK
ncbi:MAG: outer membrane lipid asymmetry maintenance protein MlaD [Chromatiales bacterium 21-64-14]|nr:MAG: outer membrane lipid asymmetry maintenance protein MlaD [Chromatiales bacterium 21-64-14]HQU14936.1 outer membrane lipid asymmetry maintenance protein MlaD [Gammaproteobacteria bacterium]